MCGGVFSPLNLTKIPRYVCLSRSKKKIKVAVSLGGFSHDLELEAIANPSKVKLTIMKPLQYFLTATSLSAPDSEPLSFSKGLADRVRNYCMSMLMFVVTGHAVALKFKNMYEKNASVVKEGVQILRIFFLTGRNILYDDCQGLLIQVKGFAPDLYAQVDAITPGYTVVSIFLQYLLPF
jgi:hypothetical protein